MRLGVRLARGGPARGRRRRRRRGRPAAGARCRGCGARRASSGCASTSARNVADRLLRLALLHEREAEAVARLRGVGVDRDRPAVRGDRAVRVAHLEQQRAQPHAAPDRKRRGERHRAAQVRRARLRASPCRLSGEAQVVLRLGVVRPQPHRGAQRRGRALAHPSSTRASRPGGSARRTGAGSSAIALRKPAIASAVRPCRPRTKRQTVVGRAPAAARCGSRSRRPPAASASRSGLLVDPAQQVVRFRERGLGPHGRGGQLARLRQAGAVLRELRGPTVQGLRCLGCERADGRKCEQEGRCRERLPAEAPHEGHRTRMRVARITGGTTRWRTRRSS